MPDPSAVLRNALNLRGLRAVALLALGMFLAGPASAEEDRPAVQIRVVGGLAGLPQYLSHEEPFWSKRVPEITGGRVRARIAPFDRSGIRGQEMLQFMRLGVVPFGTVLLGLAASEEPELSALDLPAMNPDMPTLRRTVELWRPRLEALLRERYGVEILAVYTYPAQVVFCRRGFRGLADLAGRRVRTSGVDQSELIAALGAIPVVTPFAGIVSAVRSGVVECAITGTLSGNAVGLHEVTTHVSRRAVGWGVSFFGANRDAWEALPPEIRQQLRSALATLQEEIWSAADRQTEEGLACNAGHPSCTAGRRGRMTVVDDRWQDEPQRLRLLWQVVLPGWVRRCGRDCADAWNRHVAPVVGLRATAD